eukprot:6612227-Lingulodinium_polyedra.AAC.1
MAMQTSVNGSLAPWLNGSMAHWLHGQWINGSLFRSNDSDNDGCAGARRIVVALHARTAQKMMHIRLACAIWQQN